MTTPSPDPKIGDVIYLSLTDLVQLERTLDTTKYLVVSTRRDENRYIAVVMGKE